MAEEHVIGAAKIGDALKAAAGAVAGYGNQGVNVGFAEMPGGYAVLVLAPRGVLVKETAMERIEKDGKTEVKPASAKALVIPGEELSKMATAAAKHAQAAALVSAGIKG